MSDFDLEARQFTLNIESGLNHPSAKNPLPLCVGRTDTLNLFHKELATNISNMVKLNP